MKRLAVLLLPLLLAGSVASPADPARGVAMIQPQYTQDLQTVGAGWYYTWTTYPTAGAANYVPMSREGLFDLARLSADYDGYMLVFNEPNQSEPYGADLSPQEAATRYTAIRAAYPNAVMVVGNASAWALDWYTAFIAALPQGTPRPTHWGVHGYVEAWITPAHLIDWWTDLHDTIGGIWWVTEFADTTGNTATLHQLVTFVQVTQWIERYAYFTNRYTPADYIPDTWHDFNLIDDTGWLTDVGQVYAAWSVAIDEIHEPEVERVKPGAVAEVLHTLPPHGLTHTGHAVPSYRKPVNEPGLMPDKWYSLRKDLNYGISITH
jgi:hypothetical protein